jgi:hypothetical protein
MQITITIPSFQTISKRIRNWNWSLILLLFLFFGIGYFVGKIDLPELTNVTITDSFEREVQKLVSQLPDETQSTMLTVLEDCKRADFATEQMYREEVKRLFYTNGVSFPASWQEKFNEAALHSGKDTVSIYETLLQELKKQCPNLTKAAVTAVGISTASNPISETSGITVSPETTGLSILKVSASESATKNLSVNNAPMKESSTRTYKTRVPRVRLWRRVAR